MFVTLHQHLRGPWEMFEHSAYQRRVQTAPSVPGKFHA